jgi:hypothetical protein
LAEWTSPNNQIVIRYNEPDLYLIGKIYHADYRLESQDGLDELAKALGVKRPQVFSFSSLQEMVDVVKEFKDKEGVCLYFNAGQNIVKIKGNWYLSLHRLKSELSSLGKVLDLYLERGQPSYQEFYDYVQGIFDFELAEFVRPNMTVICEASKEVNVVSNGMKDFINNLRSEQLVMNTPFKDARKDAAMKIFAAYGKERAGFCFKILDNRELNKEDLKKMYSQIFEK